MTKTLPYVKVDSVLLSSLNSLQHFDLISTLDIISEVSLPNPLSSNGCRPFHHNDPQQPLWTQTTAQYKNTALLYQLCRAAPQSPRKMKMQSGHPAASVAMKLCPLVETAEMQ